MRLCSAFEHHFGQLMQFPSSLPRMQVSTPFNLKEVVRPATVLRRPELGRFPIWSRQLLPAACLPVYLFPIHYYPQPLSLLSLNQPLRQKTRYPHSAFDPQRAPHRSPRPAEFARHYPSHATVQHNSFRRLVKNYERTCTKVVKVGWGEFPPIPGISLAADILTTWKCFRSSRDCSARWKTAREANIS